MKPMHSNIKWLSRCPCCVSKYSSRSAPTHKKAGKGAARQQQKRETRAAMKDTA